jgi:hypothetical protein
LTADVRIYRPTLHAFCLYIRRMRAVSKCLNNDYNKVRITWEILVVMVVAVSAVVVVVVVAATAKRKLSKPQHFLSSSRWTVCFIRLIQSTILLS